MFPAAERQRAMLSREPKASARFQRAGVRRRPRSRQVGRAMADQRRKNSEKFFWGASGF